MIDEPDPDIEKLKGDLKAVSERLKASRYEQRAELLSLPEGVIESFLEDGKLNQGLREEYKILEEQGKNYLKGPEKRASNAREHLEEISRIMDEIRENPPKQSEATIRRAANKRYGILLREQGQRDAPVPYYRDDANLRKRLKNFKSKV